MRLTTTDLYESSYLHCSGVELVRAWVDRGRRRNTVVFLFEGNGELTRLQTAYHTGAAHVNLATYRESLEELRELMFRLLRNRPSRRTQNQNPTGTPTDDTLTASPRPALRG